MIRLYLSSLSPWNSTYSTEDGHLVFKVEETSTTFPRKVTFYRAMPDLTLPTSERQLWEERHFFETHASTQRGHPELDGQGSGISADGLILEENREGYSSLCASAVESDTSLYEFPLAQPKGSLASPARRTRSLSPSRTSSVHSDTHPFWTKEVWVHFADVEYHQVHSTLFNVSGKEFAADDFFEKSGWLASKSRSFTAWDGNVYKWDLKDRDVKLWRCTDRSQPDNPPDELLVAEFNAATISSTHRRKLTPPTLAIYPEGEPIVDLILVTFVYGEIAAREGLVNNRTPIPQMAASETKKESRRLSWKRLSGTVDVDTTELPISGVGVPQSLVMAAH